MLVMNNSKAMKVATLEVVAMLEVLAVILVVIPVAAKEDHVHASIHVTDMAKIAIRKALASAKRWKAKIFTAQRKIVVVMKAN